MRRALLSLLLIFAMACGDDGESDAFVVSQWGTFEAAIARPVLERNPFDSRQTTVSGEFVAPSGQRLVTPAFVTRSYRRSLVDGREVLEPTGVLTWMIRFTPNEQGRWRWRWFAEAGGNTEQGPWQEFSVGPPMPSARGFVRRAADPRYLVFDDGTSFWALGENVGWYDERGTFAYDLWLERLAAAGGNFIRVWMPSWAFGLEWITRDRDGRLIATTLGNYGDRLDRAWQLDYVFEAARKHGIQVMLTIQNHGPFSLSANSEWQDNPYNVANGGPLVRPADFFTDAEARRLFRDRLRYIVGRWGHATNLLAWELWNEVDLAEHDSLEDVAAWHREMAEYIRSIDPYDHLITTSTSGGDAFAPRFGALWEIASIDLVQLHLYGAGLLKLDFAGMVPALVESLLLYGKPVLLAEAGVDFRGPAETIAADPHADGFHDILWIGLFAQTFGSGMNWWWDNVVDPANLYFHFAPLAHYVEGVDFAAENFVAGGYETEAGGRPIRVYVLRGDRVVLAWVKNATHTYYSPDTALIEDATIDFRDLTGLIRSGEWLDTRTGNRRPVEGLSADPLVLRVPAFRRDIALRLETSASFRAGMSASTRDRR